ncbi:MAG: hypothetical protein ACXVLX_10200, partial [Ilumatobacteraceae bacterium]
APSSMRFTTPNSSGSPDHFVRSTAECSGGDVAEQYPVFIPVRDRLSPLVELLGWLESVGQHDIWLIDNASTYPP